MRRFLSRLLLALVAGEIVVAAAFIALLVVFQTEPANEGRELVSAPPSFTQTVPTAAAFPPATPAPGTPAAGGEAPSREGTGILRLRLPRLEIDAPIITLGVDPDGTMQSPDNPTDVAWYSFSALPGEGSNIVMAGHLDFINYGPAVFYRLNGAQQGDELELALEDGSVARYAVLGVTMYDEASAPVLEIVGPTSAETVTLITCGGSFDPASREYDKRVILRAERVPDQSQIRS